VKIVYSCYGGSHSSPVAAAVHLGRLPRIRVPGMREIKNVKHFDRVDGSDRGRVFFVGEDSNGNQVYILGRGNQRKAIETAVKSGLMLAGGTVDDVVFVDTLKCVNMAMRLGGFLSRRLKLIKLGRPLVIFGTRAAYKRLVAVVDEVKENLQERGSSS